MSKRSLSPRDRDVTSAVHLPDDAGADLMLLDADDRIVDRRSHDAPDPP